MIELHVQFKKLGKNKVEKENYEINHGNERNRKNNKNIDYQQYQRLVFGNNPDKAIYGKKVMGQSHEFRCQISKLNTNKSRAKMYKKYIVIRGAAIMESDMEVPPQIKIGLPYDLATPFLGIYPKEFKAGSQRYICTPIFIAALFTIAKRWK